MSNSGIAGALLPPPPGVTPNTLYDEPDAKSLALNITCLIFVTGFVFLRSYTKVFALKSFGWDDGFLIFGWAWTVIWYAINLKASQQGFGRHMWDIPRTKAVSLTKWVWISGNIYLVAILFVKISFFLTYMRIFVRRRSMTYLCWFGIFACTVFYIVTLFRTVFTCSPIAKYYNPRIPGHCLPPSNLGYISGGFNAVSDMYITILPLPYVWSLQMPLMKKLRVASVFALGAFCIAVSWVRFAETFYHFADRDRFYALWYVLVWAVLELTVGLIAAACLVLPAFMSKVVKPIYESLSSRYTHSGSRDASSNGKSHLSQGTKLPKKGYTAFDSSRNLNSSAVSSDSNEKMPDLPTETDAPTKNMSIQQTRTFQVERDGANVL